MKQHNIFTNRAILYSLVLSAKIIKSKEFSDKDIRQYPDFQGKSFFMIFKHILIRTYFRKFRTLVSDLSRDFVLFFLFFVNTQSFFLKSNFLSNYLPRHVFGKTVCDMCVQEMQNKKIIKSRNLLQKQ